MPRLTPAQKEAVIRRRECRSDKDDKVHCISNLVIHHKDRDPENNDPET